MPFAISDRFETFSSLQKKKKKKKLEGKTKAATQK